jgi:hypothetical protein
MARRTYVTISVEEDGKSASITRESMSEWPDVDATRLENLLDKAHAELHETLRELRSREG